MKKVFIDGSAGTTGLRIRERLMMRRDLEVVTLPETLRKDVNARREALNTCEVAFLCLPDAAAIEAVSMVTNDKVVIIDTSTAHRTAAGWEYGFPELTGRRERIGSAKRIANPGCHATGFISLVAPLVEHAVLAPEVELSAFSLTGYSGGGKKMIADYETAHTPLHDGGRIYALGQTHKHLPEMKTITGIVSLPIFTPIVVPHYAGMLVTIPLVAHYLKGGISAVRACYAEYYATKGVVHYTEASDEAGFLSSAKLSGRDDLELSVWGNDERVMLAARFDNLGKGASGAAIQNMNIALGFEETEGLVL